MTVTVEKWDVFETAFAGPAGGNPFKEIELSVIFYRGYRTIAVRGFYEDEGLYKVRFMPDSLGSWTYRTRSNVPELDGKEGRFTCVEPSSGNHGPVVVDNYHHFRYADGTFYSCIGTTTYGWIHQGNELAQTTLNALRTSPFNKVRMAIFPKSYKYNEHNDPDLFAFPLLKKGGGTFDGHWESKGGKIEWQFDFERFDTAFFRMLEQRILQLRKLNVEADLILYHPYDRWGFAEMSRETDLFYLRYVLARIGAFRNVWWSLANEFDLMRHKKTEDWEVIGATIAEDDPYHRLISIHNGIVWFDHRRSWVTHCSIQTNDFAIPKWREEYRKPVVIDEMCYEGNCAVGWGNLSPLEMVHNFWDVVLSGGYPGHSEVYVTPEHVMWWNKGGTLKGESEPRIAYLRSLMESGPDMGLDPHPEWMSGMPCGCKTDRWILVYTGSRQPAEAWATLPVGREYSLTYIDVWEMTSVITDATVMGQDGEVCIPLTGKAYMAFLLEAKG